MVYVTADLHGLELARLKALLKKVRFSDSDWLYILGDVIDRKNDGGVAILKWLTVQPNAQLILGNHEAMRLSCDVVFRKITDESIKNLSGERLALLNNYMLNGGDVTVKALGKLKNENPEWLEDIADYLKEAPLYETVTAGGRDFLLVHAGLDNFSPEKDIADYSPDELLWARPELADRYYEDIITVFGHTPTMSYGGEYKGKILKTDTWIDVDVGVPHGNNPCLLRLDDLEAFYL